MLLRHKVSYSVKKLCYQKFPMSDQLTILFTKATLLLSQNKNICLDQNHVEKRKQQHNILIIRIKFDKIVIFF